PVVSVSTLASSGTSTTTGSTAPSAPPASGTRLFTGSGANWLYSAPTGSGINIASITGGMQFAINVHTGGFDYPVQYTDGSHGCTNFTDTLQYNYGDH